MKKVKFLVALVAFIFAVSMNSCQKTTDDVTAKSDYASFTAGGDAVAQIGDMDELKSGPIAPNVGGYWWDARRLMNGSWASINGDEFLPGSDAYNDWHNGQNPVFIAGGSGQSFKVTFCPILPLEIIAKVTTGGNSNDPIAYAGKTPLAAPTSDDFPCPVRCIRFGSRARLNAKELTDLPGYTNWNFTLEYVANPFDKNATIAQTATTLTGWFNYAYTGSTSTMTTAAGVADADGDRTIVDVLDYMMSGTYSFDLDGNGQIGAGETGLMKLTIYYDQTSVVKYVSVPPLGKSKKYVCIQPRKVIMIQLLSIRKKLMFRKKLKTLIFN